MEATNCFIELYNSEVRKESVYDFFVGQIDDDDLYEVEVEYLNRFNSKGHTFDIRATDGEKTNCMGMAFNCQEEAEEVLEEQTDPFFGDYKKGVAYVFCNEMKEEPLYSKDL